MSGTAFLIYPLSGNVALYTIKPVPQLQTSPPGLRTGYD